MSALADEIMRRLEPAIKEAIRDAIDLVGSEPHGNAVSSPGEEGGADQCPHDETTPESSGRYGYRVANGGASRSKDRAKTRRKIETDLDFLSKKKPQKSTRRG
jgi:hypothetical protein